MSDRAWKRAERAFGSLLGLVRAGAVGREGPDLVPPEPSPKNATWLAPEVKAGEKYRIPSWQVKAIGQAVENSGPGQLPFVIVHRPHQRFEDALVLVRLGDILALADIEHPAGEASIVECLAAGDEVGDEPLA